MNVLDYESCKGNCCEASYAALTFSPVPVAPSISSITRSTGFSLPTANPDSSAGRIRSSTTEPERASLRNFKI